MIQVTRLNDSVLMINVEKIQSLQATPDTVITFTNHDRLMVKEPVEEISQRIAEYQRSVNPVTGSVSGSGLEMMGSYPEKPPSDKNSPLEKGGF
jgi:flagellar protein FlbD